MAYSGQYSKLKNSIHWLTLHALTAIFLFSRLNWIGGSVQHEWAFSLTLIYAQSVTLFYGGRIFLKVTRMQEIDPLHQKAIAVSSVVFCLLPLIIIFFIQHFATQYLLLNAGFFFIAFVHLKKNQLHKRVTPFQLDEQTMCNDSIKESERVIVRSSKKSKQIKAYKQLLAQLDADYQKQSKLLSECLKNNSRLKQESAEKSIQIEQYKKQHEATVESVLHKYGLTKSQLDVVKMMIEGKTNVEIADKLFIKEGVVRTHLSAAYRKVGVRGANKLRFFVLKQINSK